MALAQGSRRAALAFRPTQIMETPVIRVKPPAQSQSSRIGTAKRTFTTKTAPKHLAAPSGARNIANSSSLSAAQVAEYYELRGLFETLPFVTRGPQIQPEEEFKFPTGTLFKAQSPDVGLNMAPAYARALREHGVAAIELGFDDPDSQFILNVVETMGCRADTHSATQGALWDVTFRPEGVKSEGTGKSAHSISHSLGEFNWHTDAAFEKDPMRFFGFHILHPDKQGGGVFRLLRSEDLIKLLSPESVNTLLNHEFDLKVPAEFYKGQGTVKGKLLHHDDASGQLHVRFRQDILQSPPSNDPAACRAVEELLKLLEDPESVGKNMPVFAFKENMVLLMDNARFLHSRTNIKDPKRWLRRVRFRGNPGESVGPQRPRTSGQKRPCGKCIKCKCGKRKASKVETPNLKDLSFAHTL